MTTPLMSEVTSPVRLARRIVFLIILAVIIVPLGSCAIWRTNNARALKALEKAARDRGEPITLAELAATYPEIPDEQNRYIALEALWESEDPAFWKAFRDGQRPMPECATEDYSAALPVLSEKWQWSRNTPLNDEQRAASAAFLAAKSSHMTAVRAALKRPKFRARYDFNQGFLMLMPNLALQKKEAQYFQIEVLHAIEVGNPDRAIDAIHTLAQLGHCLKEDPLLISQLVRIAIYSMAFTSTDRLMAMTNLNANQLARLQSILAELDTRPGLQLAFKAERAVGLDVCKNDSKQLFQDNFTAPGEQSQANWESTKVMLMVNGLAISGLKDADLRLMGETYAQLIEIAAQPDFCATDALNERLNAATDNARRIPPKIMSAIMLPALGKAGEKFARVEALRRSALVAIQIEELRLAHPDSAAADWRKVIDSQPGELRNDPFSGAPLLFKQTSNGYVIYSVGPNRADDGGQVQGPAGRVLSGAADIGFAVD
jgi:hypothetical protein